MIGRRRKKKVKPNLNDSGSENDDVPLSKLMVMHFFSLPVCMYYTTI